MQQTTKFMETIKRVNVNSKRKFNSLHWKAHIIARQTNRYTWHWLSGPFAEKWRRKKAVCHLWPINMAKNQAQNQSIITFCGEQSNSGWVWIQNFGKKNTVHLVEYSSNFKTLMKTWVTWIERKKKCNYNFQLWHNFESKNKPFLHKKKRFRFFYVEVSKYMSDVWFCFVLNNYWNECEARVEKKNAVDESVVFFVIEWIRWKCTFSVWWEKKVDCEKRAKKPTERERCLLKNRVTLFLQKTGSFLVDRLRNLYQSDGLENIQTALAHSHSHQHRHRPMHWLINNINHTELLIRSVVHVFVYACLLAQARCVLWSSYPSVYSLHLLISIAITTWTKVKCKCDRNDVELVGRTNERTNKRTSESAYNTWIRCFTANAHQTFT